MQVRNTTARYGVVAQILHWAMALTMIAMIALGLYMTSLTDIAQRFELTQLHKSIGLTLLVLAVLRLAWRVVNPVPPLPTNLKSYERVLAHVTHIGLYLVIFAIPISGWIMVSASGYPIGTVFGLFPIPDLMATNDAVDRAARNVHGILGWVLVGLLVLHVAGAVKHHFILKDDVLRRMVPGAGVRSQGEPT